MNRLFIAVAAMSSCAIGFAAYTDISAQAVVDVPIAAIHEAIDRGDYQGDQAGLAQLCEDGWTVPGHSLSACRAAYLGAYMRGEFDRALHFAMLACERDKDRAQCRKANVLTVRMNQGAPITGADILAAALEKSAPESGE